MLFPSPCGVNIVGNVLHNYYLLLLLVMFPSPCGVNIVGNNPDDYKPNKYCRLVSVPLRGKYCRELDKLETA